VSEADMPPVHILVDFENTQPGATDVALLQGHDLRLWIFRGPGQKKYDAELTEALQPLGERVGFVRCEKSGRNAVDMHVAFHLGRLAAGAAGEASPRFVVVSRDTDYEPLLQYLRAQGYEASRATSLKAAVAGTVAAAPRLPALVVRRAKPSAPVPARKRAESPAPKGAETDATPAARARRRGAESRASRDAAESSPAPAHAIPAVVVEKLVKQLRDHPKSRPAKRKALEKFVSSRLPAGTAAGGAAALVDDLVARELIRLTGSEVTYPQW
jgi:hypothetical protein